LNQDGELRPQALQELSKTDYPLGRSDDPHPYERSDNDGVPVPDAAEVKRRTRTAKKLPALFESFAHKGITDVLRGIPFAVYPVLCGLACTLLLGSTDDSPYCLGLIE